MKKYIILLLSFFLVGCTNNLTSTNLDKIKGDVLSIIENRETHLNTSGIGFKYYKPRDFSILEMNEFNHVLLHESIKYFLNVDINAYLNKFIDKFQDEYSYYYKTDFNYNDAEGYVVIRNENNGYFYIKMMYNYSYIEVNVPEREINDAIIDSAIILSSIEYNEKVLESLVSTTNFDSRETEYNIKQPAIPTDKNILDVYEYDSYE